MPKKYDKEKYIKQKQEKIDELNQKLIDGVSSIYESENYKNYLKLTANFANYSTNNKILVYLQNPEATLVKTYKGWNELERTVNKGEKAIHILAPNKYLQQITKSIDSLNENELQYVVSRNEDTCTLKIPRTSFKIINVFDVSQTDGKELPSYNLINILNEEMSETNYNELSAAIEDTIHSGFLPDISISYKTKEEDTVLANGANGYFKPSENLIVVDRDMPNTQKIKTLIHECAHSLLHGEEMKIENIEDTSFLSSRPDKECQAESVAYIVCNHLGIDSADYSFGYVAGWINQKPEILLNNLDVINKCANSIMQELDKQLEPLIEQLESQNEEERGA